MSKTKKIVIAVISVILVLILAGVMYVVFKNGSLKKVSSLTDIEISISEQTDTDKNSPNFGETYLLQTITVKNDSSKDIILQCNTNEDATSFVGLNYLDKIGNESESDNVYTFSILRNISITHSIKNLILNMRVTNILQCVDNNIKRITIIMSNKILNIL